MKSKKGKIRRSGRKIFRLVRNKNSGEKLCFVYRNYYILNKLSEKILGILIHERSKKQRYILYVCKGKKKASSKTTS